MPKTLHLIAIVAYTIGFSALVFHLSKVVKIILLVSKDAAFILSMSSADQCTCCIVSSVTLKMQTDKQTAGFAASYTVIEDSLIRRCDETKELIKVSKGVCCFWMLLLVVRTKQSNF